MKSFIILLFASILLCGFVSAETSISVTSVEIQDYLDGVTLGTGDRINIALTTYDSRGIDDIKSMSVKWGNSWVDCMREEFVDIETEKWRCIVTVTPFMNGRTDIFASLVSRREGTNNILVGTYFLNGYQFPQNPNCIQEVRCQKYEKICHNECRTYNKRTGKCVSHKKVCETTDNCIKSKTIKICSNR